MATDQKERELVRLRRDLTTANRQIRDLQQRVQQVSVNVNSVHVKVHRQKPGYLCVFRTRHVFMYDMYGIFWSPRDHRYRISFNIPQNIFSLVGFSETGRPTSVANRQNQYTCKDFLFALTELSHGDEWTLKPRHRRVFTHVHDSVSHRASRPKLYQ